MRYALLPFGIRAEAQPGVTATCPTCRGRVAAKCGQIVAWHWAHVAKECDEWSEIGTDWHRRWQDLAPAAQREVVIGNHRADILAADGTVIELQHSSLPAEQIAAREKHYGQMVWIFDAVEAYELDRLQLRQRDGYVSFRWKHPRKSIGLCRRPVLLDLGVHLLHVKRVYTKAPCGGWGRLVVRAQVERLIHGTLDGGWSVTR